MSRRCPATVPPFSRHCPAALSPPSRRSPAALSPPSRRSSRCRQGGAAAHALPQASSLDSDRREGGGPWWGGGRWVAAQPGTPHWRRREGRAGGRRRCSLCQELLARQRCPGGRGGHGGPARPAPLAGHPPRAGQGSPVHPTCGGHGRRRQPVCTATALAAARRQEACGRRPTRRRRRSSRGARAVGSPRGRRLPLPVAPLLPRRPLLVPLVRPAPPTGTRA